jgi:non-ribosomal peptide synthetase component E (peptide arylation enzyme)
MSQREVDEYVAAGVLTNQGLAAAFRKSFARFAERIALSDPDGLITYAELDEITDRGAAALWRLGLRPTDRALFQMRNCRELVFAFFSCLKIGVIPVCTLAAHREQEIGYLGQHSLAKAHFIHADDERFDMVGFAARMKPLIPTIEQVITVRAGEPIAGMLRLEELIAAEDLDAARALVASIELDPYQVAVFQLSGGTSGVPKIIPRFGNEYRYGMQSVIDFMGLPGDIVTFTPNPFMHNAAMSCFWGPTLLVGGEVTIAGGPSMKQIEEAIATRRPRWFAMAKVHLMRLIEREAVGRLDLSNVFGFAVPDGAPVLRRLLGAPCYHLYGMTEGLLAHCRPGDPEEALVSTVGRATSPYDEIRIVRPGTEDVVPDGETGELIVRGPCTIRGYFDAPERDAEAMTADGFYRSGDLMSFRVVEGERYLVFNGRVKDVVDRGGEKINCSEVEVAIGDHPAVLAVACVAMPDPLYGERMCAFVVPRAGVEEPDLTVIGSFLEGRGLAKFKWPERIELVSELPMTTSGKVSKPLMREIIAAKLKAEAGETKTLVG